MPSITRHFLVIEQEYLIAMDAERILTAALDCVVFIATLGNFRDVLKEQRFDIVLLDIGAGPRPSPCDLAAILATGAKLVFTTADDDFAAGVPGFGTGPVLIKPYDEGQLVTLINLALGTSVDFSG